MKPPKPIKKKITIKSQKSKPDKPKVPATYGRALPFDRTFTEESYGGRGTRNTITRQQGFDVAIRNTGRGYAGKSTRPGYVTETSGGYEDTRMLPSAPSLKRGGGRVYLKAGGVVGPKNVEFSTDAIKYAQKARARDKGIKRNTTKQTNMAKAGRNTTGRRRAF